MTTTTAKARRLTDLSVKRLRPPEHGRVQIPDSIITALWLRLSASGVRSWSVLYRVPGRKAAQRLTLGKWPAISCGDARKLAREVLLDVARGRDPQAAKRARRHANGDSFEEVVAEWLRREITGRQKTARDLERLVERRLIGSWAGRPIGSITKPDVLRLLDAEMDAGHERTALKLHGLIKRLFAWSVERGYCTANPAAGLRPPAKMGSRDRVLSDAELAAIRAAADVLGWPRGSFVKILVLTGQRRSEAAAMTWTELDLERRLWSIPAARSKSGRAHDVPLSASALEVLEQAPRFAGSPFVFSTYRGTPLAGFSDLKRRLDHLSGVSGWTLHDLRRTAASGMARLGVQPHVISAILNHSPGRLQGITATYNRYKYSQEKQQALDLWAAHVAGLVSGGAKVVQLL